MTSTRFSAFRALVLLWLAGNGLRLTILAVPPVLALIIVDLKLSGTQVGILNAIPVFLFALVSVPGSLLIARVGAVPALIIGLLARPAALETRPDDERREPALFLFQRLSSRISAAQWSH